MDNKHVMPPLFLAACFLLPCFEIHADAEQEKEYERGRLITVRTGNTVHLSWKSSDDRVYTILIASRPNAGVGGSHMSGNVWQPLPSAVRIPGTGGVMTLTDVIPKGAKRYYRLSSQPVKKKKKRFW